jgi:UDP-glucose 4-epimerase
VREILGAMQTVSGAEFNIVDAERRKGDPVSLVADAAAIREHLGWSPSREDITLICRSAYQWEKKLQEGFDVASTKQ